MSKIYYIFYPDRCFPPYEPPKKLIEDLKDISELELVFLATRVPAIIANFPEDKLDEIGELSDVEYILSAESFALKESCEPEGY